MPGPKLTLEDIEFLKNNRDKMSNRELAQTLGCSVHTIIDKVRKYGLPLHKVSKYTPNEHYFDELTLENCYYGGFIAADGCIYPRYKQLSFELQIRDYTQLLRFASLTEFGGKVYLKERPNRGWSAQMYVVCERWVEQLRHHFNIVPKKSLILQPPNLQDVNQILAYSIGYVDGDGTVGKYTNNLQNRTDWFVGASGTYELLSFIKCAFDDLVPPVGKPASVLGMRRGGQLQAYRFIYQIRGKRAEHILSKLVSIDCPHLDRKWNKVREELL